MKQSAGILVYRFEKEALQFLLVHPGGPFWVKKDLASWSIPKGEFENDEDALAAAKREFFEETGVELSGEFKKLEPIKQKSGKAVYTWAIEASIDESAIKSNIFELEWPPKSGKMQQFPEIDRAEWFLFEEAKEKILPAQLPLLIELNNFLK